MINKREQLMDFNTKTAPEVIKVLEEAKTQHTRIRLFLGDTETGEVWMEEHDVVGYVGNSMGPQKVPILLYNASSISGGAILTHCILAVRDKERWLYKHPKFKVPLLRACSTPMSVPSGYTVAVDHLKDGSWDRVANFNTPSQADRYVDFMTGKRICE
jgi:hypothetical protein